MLSLPVFTHKKGVIIRVSASSLVFFCSAPAITCGAGCGPGLIIYKLHYLLLVTRLIISDCK